jgi:hypothetical protein
MTIRNHLATAAAVVVLATLGILYLLLPADRLSAVTMTSAVAVALSLGSLIYLPSAFAPAAKTGAARLAGIGPMGVTTALTLILSIAALATGLSNLPSIAWALLVLAAASLIVGILLTNVTRKVVDDVQIAQQKDDRYRVWTRALNEAALAMNDGALKLRCDRIAEELRYAPSARAIDAKGEASHVAIAISALQASAVQGDLADIASKLNRLQALMAAHTSALIALRSQA